MANAGMANAEMIDARAGDARAGDVTVSGDSVSGYNPLAGVENAPELSFTLDDYRWLFLEKMAGNSERHESISRGGMIQVLKGGREHVARLRAALQRAHGP